MNQIVSGVLGVDIANTSTTQDFALGQCVTGENGSEYVYVQANGAIAQYDALGIDENYQAAPLTKAMADDGWNISFAQIAFADNEYGWVAKKGSNISCNVLASCAADAALYTSATAGSLDDDATSQTKIDGVVAVVADGGSGGEVEVIATYPRSTTF